LTNNISGVVQTAETEMEDLDAEMDEVPDLPRLPRTFLAHHARGTRSNLVFQQNVTRFALISAHILVTHVVQKRRHRT